MVTELDLVKVKPRRAVAYLRILARYVKGMEEHELKITPTKADLILAREGEFRIKVENKIQEIDTNISKALYKIHQKINRLKTMPHAGPDYNTKKKKGRALRRKDQGNKITVVKDEWLNEHARKLEEIHRLREKIRLLEEKYIWLSNKGFDSQKLRIIQQRILKSKDVIYHRLDIIVGDLSGEQMTKHRVKRVVPRANVGPEALTTSVIGNTTNKTYHKVSCRIARMINPERKVVIESEEEAKKQKFKPCKVCLKKRKKRVKKLPSAPPLRRKRRRKN